MEKLDPKTDSATPDIVEQNIEKIKAFFPDIFRERKVDLDALHKTLCDYADERWERYSFTCNRKKRARKDLEKIYARDTGFEDVEERLGV